MHATYILFRHFQTQDDMLKLHTPSDANPDFVSIASSEVKQLRDQFEKIVNSFSINRLITSDTNRGRMTAEILRKGSLLKVSLYEDAKLRNMNQPEWIGLSYSEITKTDVYKIWHTAPEQAIFKGGCHW